MKEKETTVKDRSGGDSAGWACVTKQGELQTISVWSSRTSKAEERNKYEDNHSGSVVNPSLLISTMSDEVFDDEMRHFKWFSNFLQCKPKNI